MIEGNATTYCFDKPSRQAFRILEGAPRAPSREQRHLFLQFLIVRACGAHQDTSIASDHDETLPLLDSVAAEEPGELLGCLCSLSCASYRMACGVLGDKEVAKLQDALISFGQNG